MIISYATGMTAVRITLAKRKKGRLEWHIYMSRKLLFIYKENADTSQTTRNKKNVWDDKTEALHEETSSNIAASL